MKRRKDNNKEINKLYSIAKYSGLAFEMLGIIVLGSFAGYKLDENSSREFPLWTVTLSLFAVFSSLYLVIKKLIK